MRYVRSICGCVHDEEVEGIIITALPDTWAGPSPDRRRRRARERGLSGVKAWVPSACGPTLAGILPTSVRPAGRAPDRKSSMIKGRAAR